MTQPDGERLASLEEWRRMSEADMDRIVKKVDEMHAVLMQAKGAKYAIVSIAGLAGVLGSIISKYLPFLSGGR